MREILFRGKRLDNGEWVEGAFVGKYDPLLCISYAFIIAQKPKDSFVTWYAVDPNTVGQCTGMLDQNDSRIFEGDIVQDMKGTIYMVVWGGAGFSLRYDPPHAHGHHCELLPLHNYWSAHGAIVVIIGNIHDNPDLLKGEKHDSYTY